MSPKRSRREQGEESKKLGRIAQKAFDGWCTRADLTANGSNEDDEGWDFFIQAKSSNEPVPFLDLRPPAFSALVQVKGTSDPAGGYRMTLTNALKLVINQLGPSFVFMAHVDDDGDVREAWLVHCGEEFIKKVLKAATKAKTQKQLNKTWLTFRPSSSDVVTRATLRERLEQHIGDVRQYFDWKRDVVSGVGYEEERFEVRVRYAARSEDEAYDALADFVIGLRELPVESIDMFDVRFGERRLKKTHTKPTLSRPVVASEPDAAILVEGGDGERVEVVCNGYLASAYVPFLPSRSNRLRLVAPFLEFLLTRAPDRPDTMMLRWSTVGLDSTVSPANLEDKARAAAVLRLIRQPGARGTVRMKGRPDLSVPLGGEWVFDNERAEHYLKALEDYRVVTQTFGIAIEGTAEPQELVRVAHQLNVFACIASTRELTAEVVFPKDTPPPGVALGDHVSFVFASVLGFGDTKLLIITSVGGKVEEQDERFNRVRATTLPRLGHRLFTHITEEEILNELQAGGQVLQNLGASKVFLRPFETLPSTWLPPSRSGASNASASRSKRVRPASRSRQPRRSTRVSERKR